MYDSVADLGANIGVHSMILCELGYSVSAYEPDPQTSQIAEKLVSQVKLSSQISWNQCAVVPDTFMDADATFVRVLGNTTSSHVKGAKSPYGALEEFKVPTERFSNILRGCTLVKLDVEGLEAELFQSIKLQDGYALPDILAEIGTEDNAEAVFDSASSLGLNIFAQKINWSRVESARSMPTSYREGSVFISCRDFMPWG
jgi:FkbM family methyltransferase